MARDRQEFIRCREPVPGLVAAFPPPLLRPCFRILRRRLGALQCRSAGLSGIVL